ncbi:hypothetical protein I316_07632 [Kwoniella heveanensis BCC8398]|uniref:Uncharacterized protein n=1 Tax=Kwoniella heveanensis BCC8398 TaxID=1296120 RepID=A0A1B9GIA3_9TREE|nr:hypothetical protein I316_07632 [Kwoniella heveanensis BCC8398]
MPAVTPQETRPADSSPSSSSSDYRSSSASSSIPSSDQSSAAGSLPDDDIPRDSRSTDSSNSSSPSSQLFSQFYDHPSSSSSTNPLLPSLPTSTASILASRYDPSLAYFQSGASLSSEAESESSSPHQSQTTQASQTQRQPRMPEKCFSFCTQNDNARPLCRMLCLRKRAPELTREEQLKRLRPPTSASTTAHSHSLVHISSDMASASSSSSSASGSSITSYLSAPFELLRKKVEPYSVIYVRGTPDGVVGRYMEELEWDDGEYDFGAISRGGSSKKMKKRGAGGEESKYNWIDWGDHGAVFYMPLKTIFNPITSIPSTLNTLLTPSFNLLRFYANSFTDGSQARSLEKITHEIQRGGALEMLGKLRGYWEKRVQETREKRDQMLREANSGARSDASASGAGAGAREGRDRVKDVGKEIEGKGE